jgi:hypothetical protein
MWFLESLGYQNGSRLPSLKLKLKLKMMRSERRRSGKGGSRGINALFRPHPVQDSGDATRRGARKVGKSNEKTRPSVRPAWDPAAPTASLVLSRPMIRYCKKRAVISDATGAAPSGDDSGAICQ